MIGTLERRPFVADRQVHASQKTRNSDQGKHLVGTRRHLGRPAVFKGPTACPLDGNLLGRIDLPAEVLFAAYQPDDGTIDLHGPELLANSAGVFHGAREFHARRAAERPF